MSFCFETSIEPQFKRRSLRRVAQENCGETGAQSARKMTRHGRSVDEIAHDFNNYLQIIASSLELVGKLAANGRTDEIQRHADRARDSIDLASALIRRLHDDPSSQPAGATPVDVNVALASMADLLTTTVGAAIELRFDFAEKLGSIRCDAQQLASAIVNLTVNARHAMPRGGVLLIETYEACISREEAHLRPGRYAGIAVSDTGTGMSADVLARACDPYFTTKPHGVGTGLGLASVQSFAHRFGGHVDISSVPGAGATIKLLLPCA
jgi:signal transduction histidine kinase